ncbi:MAG TPA: tetratricopeptide repeat protein [Candidatus Angelobacter sp.]|nr:tetratricopeptide repeat protein [Candidatus Angelobacter sp.]
MRLPVMTYKILLFKFVLCFSLGLIARAAIGQSTAASPASPQVDFNPSDPDRQQGFILYHEHKLPQAAELLEKVVARYPRDMAAHEVLAASLLSRAATQADPDRKRDDRLKARAELLRAKELGDTSDLCKVLLSGIPEDGSDTKFSDNKEVEEAMGRGEAAFARADWDVAIKEYTHALELDPKLYLAAVNVGDTYFRLKKWDTAGEWFSRAIAIDPDQEVAYRYWADALMGDGKMKEARQKFILGLVASPYTTTSWTGLNSWLTRNHLAYNRIAIHVPQGPTTNSKGETVITIDPANLGKKDGSDAWLTYSLERSLWKNEKFAKEYPDEKTYRHSLKEEVSALSLTATVFEEIHKGNKAKEQDPSMVMLAKLKAEGMLEPYVLLVRPDREIIRDYPDYRTAHRDKLIEFVDKYVVPPAP